MRSGPGRLPGWDVYRAGTFTWSGRLPGRDVYRAGRLPGWAGRAETFVLLVPRKY